MRRGQKNYLITFILIIFLWIALGLQVFFVTPQSIRDVFVSGIYLPFFINLFLALFLTLAVILGNSLRGLLISTSITLFLFLRLFGLGNWLNFLLIMATVFILNRYLSVKK